MTTLHLISVPHTSTTPEYSWCAFTSLARSFSSMMQGLGYEVILYAGPENDAKCSEHVNCRNGYEWTERVPPYETNHPGWRAFAEKATEEISKRYTPGDYLCLVGGGVQEPIAAAFPDARIVEPVSGYQGVMDNSYRVFPSYSWMHAVYGHYYTAAGADGRFYDAVIPHWVDMENHPEGSGDGDYILYVGRLIERKGLQIVREVAERTGLPLVVAGFGDESLVPPGANFVGSVEPGDRAQLMRNARCLLAPTLYVEPFGLVAIEAMASGTPAITTDFGAWTETVVDDVTGYRCNSLDDFCTAVEMSKDLDRSFIRQRTIDLYSAEAVGVQYNDFFEHLETLKGAGWYA